jgi:hypothetical protein
MAMDARRPLNFQAQTSAAVALSAPSKPPRRLVPTPAIRTREQRAFPQGSRPLPSLIIRDEVLEVYAFVFCQGGFRQLGMTFEQFLRVATVVRTPDATRWSG